MRSIIAIAVGVGMLCTGHAARADTAPDCSTNRLHVALPSPNPNGKTLRLAVGETQTIKVTGRTIPTPTPTPTPLVLQTVQAQTAILNTTVPKGSTVTVQPPPPAVTPTNIPSPVPLQRTLYDSRIASIASEVSTTVPVAEGLVPSTTYTIKGLASGNTELYVSQGDPSIDKPGACVVVGLAVRSKEYFVTTTGVAISQIPKNTFTTVTVPAQDPAAKTTPNPPPGIYVYKTESSSSQTSVPILANYRLNDAPNLDLYASFGYFAGSDVNGPLFGVSVGRGQLLLTVGMHSALFTDYSPYVNRTTNRLEANGNATFATLPTTTSMRRQRIFISLTVPAGLITNLLGGGSK